MPRIYGADYRGLAGVTYYTALLHWVSLALVRLALLLAAWRFFAGAALVHQVLAVAIVANIVLFVTTGAGSQGPHEVAVVAPFGAALAARMLAGSQAARTPAHSVLARRAAGRLAGRVLAASPPPAVWPERPLAEQHRHGRHRRPGQGQGAGEEHHGPVPVAGQALVV